MEKICIVKLRKHFTNHASDPHLRQQGREDQKGALSTPPASGSKSPLAQGTHDSEGDANSHGDAAAKKVSLTLTQDQMKTLRFDPHMASLLFETTQAVSGKVEHGDGEMTIQLELPSLPPVRLLKLDEVSRMLQVSKGCLHRILTEGKLKSYRIGRLRRVMLDDILSYLQSQQEWPAATQDLKSKELPKEEDTAVFDQGGMRDVL